MAQARFNFTGTVMFPKVKCDIGSYIHYWRGIKKVGKTTLFYDLVQEQYGDLEKGLLIAVGDEIGYQALDGLVYAETPTWADIVEVVNDLVENKTDNNFEIVGIDTADEMIKLAKEEVKRIHKKQKGSAAEFNACLGGYGAPRDKVTELVDDILAKLRKAGYGIVIIGHTKLKDVKEKNGDEYQQLTSNLNADYDGIFANKADIVMTIAVEKNIDEAKRIKGTTRYMWFLNLIIRFVNSSIILSIYLFPTSFWMMITGRIPPCSEYTVFFDKLA